MNKEYLLKYFSDFELHAFKFFYENVYKLKFLSDDIRIQVLKIGDWIYENPINLNHYRLFEGELNYEKTNVKSYF